ncbi:MAG: hypothetical protein AMJ95_13835, partial [Omnitrophica WOR_2 bacterium SM23_72]
STPPAFTLSQDQTLRKFTKSLLRLFDYCYLRLAIKILKERTPEGDEKSIVYPSLQSKKALWARNLFSCEPTCKKKDVPYILGRPQI